MSDLEELPYDESSSALTPTELMDFDQSTVTNQPFGSQFPSSFIPSFSGNTSSSSAPSTQPKLRMRSHYGGGEASSRGSRALRGSGMGGSTTAGTSYVGNDIFVHKDFFHGFPDVFDDHVF